MYLFIDLFSYALFSLHIFHPIYFQIYVFPHLLLTTIYLAEKIKITLKQIKIYVTC